MTDTAMWLFMAVLIAVIRLVILVRAGWNWTWGMCLIHVSVLVIALIGLASIFLPQFAVYPNLGLICAWMSWVVYLCFNVGQRILVNKCLDTILTSGAGTEQQYRLIRLLTWGPPGQYWCDVMRALSLARDGHSQESDAIFERWLNDPRISKYARDALIGFRMQSQLLHHDWNGIIVSYGQYRQCNERQLSLVPIQIASRAFAETGRFAESLVCLEEYLQGPGRVAPGELDNNFARYFSLAGAVNELRALLDRSNDRRALPDFMRLFWLARCYVTRAQWNEALELMRKCQVRTPANQTLWQRTIDRWIKIIEGKVKLSDVVPIGPFAMSEAQAGVVARANRLYRRSRLVSETLRPFGNAKPVLILMFALVAAFVVADPQVALWLPLDHSTLQRVVTDQLNWLEQGQLDSRVWHGQWWRLITYIFLHGGVTHLLFNVGALYLFGNTVNNMFGPWKFVFIFFLAGILSAVFQILLMPTEPCIGASGAIMGIFGAAIAGIVKLKKVLPAHIRQAELKWMLSVAVLQVFFDQLVNNIADVTNKNGDVNRIAAFAHFGGIVAGFLIGMALPLKRSLAADAVDIWEHSG
jgi:membrane associated rhomboid family serine protease